MTAGSAIQSALLRTIGRRPQQVFASTEQECVVMADLAQEAAADIAKSHDWRGLTKIHTLAGGAASYPLPPDYDRMAFNADMRDPSGWLWDYVPVESVNDWIGLTSGTFPTLTPGGWIIFGGEIHFHPVSASGANFPYISKEWARNESGTPIAAFASDDDTFVLPERLLTLSLVWRYKELTGLEYGEDQQNYEIALAQEQTRDRGSYVLRQSTRSISGNTAYYGGAIW